jgi:hypothetical protein
MLVAHCFDAAAAVVVVVVVVVVDRPLFCERSPSLETIHHIEAEQSQCNPAEVLH